MTHYATVELPPDAAYAPKDGGVPSGNQHRALSARWETDRSPAHAEPPEHLKHPVRSRLARARPLLNLRRRRELVNQIHQRLHDKAQERAREMKTRLRSTADKLKLLGPEQVLARGYSITFEVSSGAILRNSSDAKPGDLLRTRLNKGEINSRVESP